ncbi:MAG: DsbE family thiol:disulfide interchange protein [Parvularculaceae bacterium]|nr:DsbE family thiol:disulfide interchange protein [Parvularculaceae bacterium]
MAAIGVAFIIGLTNDPRELPSTLIDKPLPEFNLPPVYEGEAEFTNDDLAGQVALVNIFGSWCAACRIEHPMLMRLTRQNAVPIYGIDWKDKPEDGAAWLRRHGDPYLRVGVDIDSKLAIDLGVTGAPETFVIDRSGRIRYKHVGPITDEVWRQTLQPLVRSLQAEAAS